MTREEFDRVNKFLDELVNTNKLYGDMLTRFKKAKTLLNSSQYTKIIAGLKTVQDKVDDMIKVGITKQEIEILSEYMSLMDELMELAKAFMSHKANDGIKPAEYDKMLLTIEMYEFVDREKKALVENFSKYYQTILGTRKSVTLQNRKGLIEDSDKPLVKMFGYLALSTRDPETMDKYIGMQKAECSVH